MTVFVGTSWKMHKTTAEARAYVEDLLRAPLWSADVQVFLIPPHTAIHAVRDALGSPSPVWVGAQNAHWEREGPFTGEISMEMVKDAGANLVELGHSERRRYFRETDEAVARKVAAAVDAGLTPLVCLGEPKAERDAGRAVEFLLAQVEIVLGRITDAERRRVLLAYEPTWSIGEHGVPASPEQVAEVAEAVRDRFEVRALLYGGSVTKDNATDFLSLQDVDGLFVGRAAWRAADLRDLISLASTRASGPGR